jgi:hypothetical protein
MNYQEIIESIENSPNLMDTWKPEMYRCFLYMPRERFKIARLMQVREGGSPFGADAVVCIDKNDNTHAVDSSIYHIIDNPEQVEYLESIFPEDGCHEDTEYTIAGRNPMSGFIIKEEEL